MKHFIRRLLRMKNLQELTADDFLRCAVWERTYEGWLSDEETVRARPGVSVVSGREDYMVRTEYLRADGTAYLGFCTPQPVEGVDGPATGVWPLYRMHHTVFAGAQTIELNVMPDSPIPADRSEPKYNALGATATRLFPITFRSPVRTTGLPLSGTLDGFCQYVAVGRAEFTR
jgi:hypothetical protein